MLDAFAEIAETVSENKNVDTKASDKVLDKINSSVFENDNGESQEISEEKNNNDITHIAGSVLDKFNDLMDSESEIDGLEFDEYDAEHSESLLDKFNEMISKERTEDLEKSTDQTVEQEQNKLQELTDEEKKIIKEETGWSDEIIDNIQNMKQYEILKSANLVEVEINGRQCLIRTDIDLDKKWNTGKFDENGNPIYETNRERMEEGKPPLDGNGRPIELHHLGQKADSPLVELTVEEHRTGEYEDGKKNQSLWHDNAKETEVHGEGNSWTQEREAHWETRSKQTNGG